MSKHTEGPWSTLLAPMQVVAGPKIVANVLRYPMDHVEGQIGFAESLANARLIAAAPELLSVVKSLLLYVETYGGEVTENISAALPLYREIARKAEGKDK